MGRASDAILGRVYAGADSWDVEPTFEQGRKDAMGGFQPRVFPDRRMEEVKVYVDGWQTGRDAFLVDVAESSAC
jgi:hypothetical protein